MKKTVLVSVITNQYVAEGVSRKRATELAEKAVDLIEQLGLVTLEASPVLPTDPVKMDAMIEGLGKVNNEA